MSNRDGRWIAQQIIAKVLGLRTIYLVKLV